MAAVEAVQKTANMQNNAKYTPIAEEYGERFAAFFGCSLEQAKALLSNPRALYAMSFLRNNFSQHLLTISHAQIAEFVKGLKSNSEKAKLAKRALDEGIAFSDLDTVYKYGESIFNKDTNKNMLSDLKHTSKSIQLIAEASKESANQNGQKTLAVA